MLTQDFKQNVMNPPTSTVGGGVPPNQPMDSEQFKAWAQPTPETSSYDVAMGTKNADGTPNTSKGIIPEAVDQVKSGFQQTKEGAQTGDITKIGRGVLNEAGGALRAIFSPIEAATKIVSQFPVIHEAVGGVDKAVNFVADKISNNKTLQDFMQKNPNADEVVGNLMSIGAALAGGKVGPEAGDVASKAAGNIADKAGNLATSAAEKVKGAVSKPPISPAQIQANLESRAISDTTPSYDKDLIGESRIPKLDANGNPTGETMPRLQEVDKEKNPLSVPKVNSTASEISAGKELSKLQGYNPEATKLSKYNFVTENIAKKSEAYRNSLANEKVVIPRKEMTSLVRRTVNETSQNSLLLQKTDPIVKNYIRVAQRAAEKVEGTLAGEDKLRLALDQAYEDAGGKYGNNKGLDQIHRAARNAITEDMAKRAQSTEVKASLKEMSNLYRASDVLKDEARKAGGSKWEQFKKQHPIITKVGKAVGRTAGLGAGVHIVP